MTRYAAYDETGIWAVGDTPAAAIEAFEYDTQAGPDDYGVLYTAPMTDRLARYIEAHGFDCTRDSYRMLEGRILDLEIAV